MRHQFLTSLCLIITLTATPVLPVLAFGSVSQEKGKNPFSPEQILHFSQKVEGILTAHGALVAILARKGRPKSELPEGMEFTHTAFAVYAERTAGDGRKVKGYALHNLYQQDKHPDRSDLITDNPTDFFAKVVELEAGIIIPSPELQHRLLAMIGSPAYAALHDPHYSVIANPYTLGRQNCTEFVLDVINSVLYRTDDIKKIKAGEKTSFVAQEVNVHPLRLFLGSLFNAEVSTSDQPAAPVTATFETIGRYLEKYDPGVEILRVTADKGP